MRFWIVFIPGIILLSLTLTYFIRVGALKHKILDIPNKRSSHSAPVPRGGGLAIVICWYLGITLLFFFGQIADNLYYAFMSGSLLAIISLIDDIISLKPRLRLLSQLASASLALFFLRDHFFINISGWIIETQFILIPLFILAIVWFINLYNFLDGIDGYASVEAISTALIIYSFTGNIICLLLVASVAGFLFWNWPKAKIFMGDVGSTQLGFILIVLGIYLNNEGQFDLILWIIITSPYWFDATLTLYRRWRNKEKLSQAHKKHIYQRIVQSGFSHLQTDMALIVLNILLAFVALIINKYDILTVPLFLSVILVLFLINRQADKKIPFK